MASPMFRSYLVRTALLAIAICLLHCAGNNSLPLIDRDEPRFAEATREMLQRNDWVVPYFNGHYRFDKPPLIYWMQAASVQVFGENEFAVRFPSAVCAALTALVLALWGARWRGPATGWRAALIFSLCAQVFMHARASVADMPMVLAFTLAAWCLWLTGEGVRRACAGFWVALALGFLAKGPIAWLPLAAIPFAPIEARRALLRPWWRPALGALVMLGIVAAWGIPALMQTGGEFATIGLGKHVVARSVGIMEGHGIGGFTGYIVTLPLYVVSVFVSLFPWSCWLPFTVKRWWRTDRHEPLLRYLGALVLLVFGVFTLVSTKLIHYTLPVFPMLALLIAAAWPDRKTHATSTSAPAPDGTPLIADRSFLKVALAWTAFTLIAAFALFPIAAKHTPSEILWRKIEPHITSDTQLATLGYQEPSLVWTLRRKATGYLDVIKRKNATEWLAKPGPRLLICESDDVAALLPKIPPPEIEAIPVDGFQIARGKTVHLVVLWKPASKISSSSHR